MSDPRATDTGAKAKRKIPPLVWIVVAILIGWFVVAMLQRGGTHVTPQGGTMPQAVQNEAVMPPAPATGNAPATPGGVIQSPGGGTQPQP